MRLRCAPALFALVALSFCVAVPGPAGAHTGGPLDDAGCHNDRRRGNFHCHRGPARGHEFRSRAAMTEAVESGDLPERPADEEGFLARLWPFGEGVAGEPEAPKAGPSTAPATSAAATVAAPAVAAAPPGAADAASPTTVETNTRKYEERLRTLDGLRERGVISDDEYETRRKAILDEL